MFSRNVSRNDFSQLITRLFLSVWYKQENINSYSKYRHPSIHLVNVLNHHNIVFQFSFTLFFLLYIHHLTMINLLFFLYKLPQKSFRFPWRSSFSPIRLSPICSLLFLSCTIMACLSFTSRPITITLSSLTAASLPALRLNVLALLQPAPRLRGPGPSGEREDLCNQAR